jgi:hypothetical protein
METNEKGIILEDGHIYRYIYQGGMKFYVAQHIGRDGVAWILMRINEEDGLPTQYIANTAMAHMQMTDGSWREVPSVERQVTVKIDDLLLVNVDLSLLEHLADSREDYLAKKAQGNSFLIHKHLYTQFGGLYLFYACNPPEDPGIWLLARLNKETGTAWEAEAEPGAMVGYMRTANGLWWQVNAPDPAGITGKKRLHRRWWPVELDPEVWTHVGASMEEYRLSDMLHYVNI